MKKLLGFCLCATLLFLAGCSKEYDDSTLVGRVDDLENRVTRIEELCKQMNTNISSLQTIVAALQNNDCITDVAAITENGKPVGYIVTFAKADPITIYHGKDDKDGNTPQIGVKLDSKGIYYWTSDGGWLLDEDGNKIKAVGTDGKDGITPLLKIENDYWYISSDNGITWTRLGRATGIDGKDGDSFFQSVTQDEKSVYFTLSDGSVITIPKGVALGIAFDEEDLIVMSPNSTRSIGYTVTSAITPVTVEVTSSADIKAKVTDNEDGGLTGKIQVTTGSTIDEYSKVIVFVSNGDRVIMRSITFEEAGLEVEDNAVKNAAAEGGEMTLEFLSNVRCEVVIPEEAQDWISIAPTTRAMVKQSITLMLEPNTGYYRSATVTVQSPDGNLKLEYQVEQSGDLGVNIDPTQIPDDEIWYRTSDNQIYDIYQCTNFYGHQPFDAKIISHTYKNGYGVIKFDAPVTKINDHTFGNSWAANMTELYLPDCIEFIGTGAIYHTGLTALHIPKNLKVVDSYGLNNPNLESFSGEHVSEDGRCVIIEDGFMIEYGGILTPVKNYMAAFAPAGITEYTLPNNVEILGWYAFAWCSELRKITFNEGLKKIQGDCFVDTHLDCEIILPSTLESLDSYAFRACSGIKGFYGNEKFHTSDNKCLISFKEFSCNSSWNGKWICGFAGHGVTDYTIPEGIVGIEHYTFESGTSLKSITLPSTIVEVCSQAFYGCVNLEAIYGPCTSEDHRCIIFGNQLRLLAARKGLSASYQIPDNITSIGYEAFIWCSELEEITMGDQITYIDGYAFGWCPNLKSITLSANLLGIGPTSLNPFLGSENLEKIYCRALFPPQYYDEQMSDFPKLKFYVPEQSLTLYQNDGNWSLFKKYFEGYAYNDLPERDEIYTSSDFSQNGEVVTLQTATKGKGINVILMGDAYSDRQISNGTYRNDIEIIYNNLFTEEPYKSFKDHFNVYYVNVVSATEGYDYGSTALGCFFGAVTFVGGNDNAVFDYALKAISEEEMDEALIVVAMNSDNYAGTCYMYNPDNSAGYGNGVSVSYFSRGGNAETFAQLLHHEACGHGFAKLADEYAYEDMGRISEDYVSQIKEQQTDWGWCKNVDFTSDLSQVRWKHFLNDSRYQYDGLGAYEGGLTYWTGVWRPTENSIMRHNTGGFNAPSREAIYYRIHKLAYGDSWEYDYEEFAEWDAKNRNASAEAAARSKARKPANYKPTHPPVIINKSWRDAK